MFTIEEINNFPEVNFIATFKNVIEYNKELPIVLSRNKPFSDFNHLLVSVNKFVDNLPFEDKIKILQAHPDLAGKLRRQIDLTDESTKEQKSAGLESINNVEENKLFTLNQRYKNKFQFPFVICAKENNLDSIFKAIEERLENNFDAEVLNGIEEVKKISGYRIKDLVEN